MDYAIHLLDCNMATSIAIKSSYCWYFFFASWKFREVCDQHLLPRVTQTPV